MLSWKCEKVGHLPEDCTVLNHLQRSDAENIADLSPYLKKLYKTYDFRPIKLY